MDSTTTDKEPVMDMDTACQESTSDRGNTNDEDWQEVVYQKIQDLRKMYLPKLIGIYQNIAIQLEVSKQHDKLRIFKTHMEPVIKFLGVPQQNISSDYKEKLASYEKQIIHLINKFGTRKIVPPLQPAQLSPPPQPQWQVTQPYFEDNLVNPQMQSTTSGNSGPTMQHKSIPGIFTGKPNTNLQLAGNGLISSLQQVTVGLVQQNSVSTPKQADINTLSPPSGVNKLQSDINSLPSNSSTILQLQQQQMLHQRHQLQGQNQQFGISKVVQPSDSQPCPSPSLQWPRPLSIKPASHSMMQHQSTILKLQLQQAASIKQQTLMTQKKQQLIETFSKLANKDPKELNCDMIQNQYSRPVMGLEQDMLIVLGDKVNGLLDEVKCISKKNLEMEDKVEGLQRQLQNQTFRMEKTEAIVEKLLADLKEKDELLDRLHRLSIVGEGLVNDACSVSGGKDEDMIDDWELFE